MISLKALLSEGLDSKYAEQFQQYILKKYHSKSINGWKANYDRMAGVIEWERPNREEVIKATPFWDGNERLPIDIADANGDEKHSKVYPFKSTGDMMKDEAAYLKIMRNYLK
jgi:hypothetical protein